MLEKGGVVKKGRAGHSGEGMLRGRPQYLLPSRPGFGRSFLIASPAASGLPREVSFSPGVVPPAACPTPAGRKNVTFPLSLDAATWHIFMLETVGDSMRASIDGKAVAFLQSPGIAHPTKSKVEFGCMGKDGFFDDLKVWNAGPVGK